MRTNMWVRIIHDKMCWLPNRVGELEKLCSNGTHTHCWWECGSIQPLWKTKWPYLFTKAEQTHTLWPSDSIPSTHPTETQMRNTWILRETLLIKAQKWKLPKGPPVVNWLSKWQYIHTMGCRSAVRMNSLYAVICMNPTSIMLSKRRQTQTEYAEWLPCTA